MRVLWAAVAFLAAAELLSAADEEVCKEAFSDQQRQAEIQCAVKQLGHNSWIERSIGSTTLWKLGQAAEPALREAAKSKDPEVAFRATSILEKFRWGLYSDTPPATGELIQDYRDESASGRAEVLEEYGERSDDAVLDALRCIMTAESSRELKVKAETRFLGALVDGALPRLSRDDETRAEALLAFAAENVGKNDLEFAGAAMRAYAAWLHAAGRLTDAEIDAVAARRARADAEGQRRLDHFLAAMHRMRGDLPKALEAVERTGDAKARLALLVESGRWKDVLALLENDKVNLRLSPVDRWIVVACCHGFNGDEGGGDRVRVEVGGNADSERLAALRVFEGKAEEAIGMAVRTGRLNDAFLVRVSMEQYDQAWDLVRNRVEAACGPTGRGPGYWDVFSLLVLAQAGQADRIKEALKGAADRMSEGPYDANFAAMLIEALRFAGMGQDAAKLVAQLVERTEDPGEMGNFIAKATGCHPDEGLAWWSWFANAFAEEPPDKRLGRVEKVVRGELAADGIAEVVGKAGEGAAGAKDPWQMRAWYDGLGRTCLRYGLTDLAVECQKRRAEVPGEYDGGDYGNLLMSLGRTAEGVAAYQRTYQDRPGDIALLWRLGFALAKAGREDEGRHLRARAMAIAGVTPWGAAPLVDDLLDGGHRREALDVLLAKMRAAEPLSDAWARLALQASLHLRIMGKSDQALRILEGACIAHLLEESPSIYRSAQLHLELETSRAISHTGAGRLERIGPSVDVLVRHSNRSTGQTIEVLRALDRAGKTALADDIVTRLIAKAESVEKRFPHGRYNPNNLAWILASTRRKPDLAVAWARKAHKIDPSDPMSCDTLAEALFRSGRQAEAIEMAERACRLDPEKSSYRQHLERFRKGDEQSEPEPDD